MTQEEARELAREIDRAGRCQARIDIAADGTHTVTVLDPRTLAEVAAFGGRAAYAAWLAARKRGD